MIILTNHIDNESGISYNFTYNEQKYFYRKNLQGDIIGIYDSCWNLLGQYEYDAWGNLLSQVGSEILNINPFRYRGYYYDAETGLYYLNSRYYDPEIGRFISPDSLKYLDPTYNNGLNLYTYCGNNPVMHVDPNGHEWWDWLAGCLIVVVLLGVGIAFSAFAAAAVAAKAAAGLIFALKASAAVLTGVAFAGGVSWSLQLANSNYGAIDFDWEQFRVDLIIGAISGFVSFGVGEMLKPIGALFGQYISQMQIGNYPLTRFVPMDVFTTIGEGIVSVVGGMAAGLVIEEQLSRTIGSGDLSPLSARIAESVHSEVFSRIVDFILDMVM